MKKCRKAISGLMIGILLVGCLSGCGNGLENNSGQDAGNKTGITNLMTGIERDTPSLKETDGKSNEERNVAMTDFSLKLLKQSMGADANVLLSPVSVIYALAMTANGAAGETKEQLLMMVQ